MTQSALGFDPDFDFNSDTRPGRDPDADSQTLRRYHQLLWSKEIRRGVRFDLVAPKFLSHGYLTYSAPGQTMMWLSSDAITHSYTRSMRPKALVAARAALTEKQRERYLDRPYTVGSAMIWPVKMGPPMTINRARGCKWSKIGDRMDLTLECIRLYYSGGQDSPLLENLAHNDEFFSLFGSFRTFVDFFHFQDLVSNDYSVVEFFLPCEDFARPATPRSVEEYITYREGTLEFINKRQQRMAAWVDAEVAG